MGCEADRCNKTSTPYSTFIVTPSLEGWPTKAEEVYSPHEVRLTPLDTNPVFQCLCFYAIFCRLDPFRRKYGFSINSKILLMSSHDKPILTL